MSDVSEGITSREAIDQCSGQNVVVEGIYYQADVRMAPKGEPVYVGHVRLTLDDGTEVSLEPIWKPEAIRSHDEISRFDGKRVAVKGVVYAQAPEPEESVTTLISPCISPVEEIVEKDIA